MESWKVGIARKSGFNFNPVKHILSVVISKIEMVNTFRNPDIAEASIETEGKPVKFCIATGFRNIQTLVRKLKAKTTMPHYVEIMACPTGLF